MAFAQVISTIGGAPTGYFQPRQWTGHDAPLGPVGDPSELERNRR
jgi:hypothetical protein